MLSQQDIGLAKRTQTENEQKPTLLALPSIQRWLRKKAVVTQRKYLSYMARFQNLTGLSPEELLGKTKTLEPVEVQDLIDETTSKFMLSIQFCCTVAIRSFLRHNGYNNLPKVELSYTPQTWHRGYKKHEVQRLLGYLPRKLHKLFVLIGIETGLRADTILELRYEHITEDFQSGVVLVAVRLNPHYHVGRKATGYTFMGQKSAEMLTECIDEGLIQSNLDSRIIPRSYHALYAAIYHAKKQARLDPRIQPCHGFRKYFESALDQAKIDHEKKMIIEGHFAGTRAKHYTERDVEDLRELYRKSYRYIGLESFGAGSSTKMSQGMEQNAQTLHSNYKSLEEKVRLLETAMKQIQESISIRN